ncbi:MAG: hypothetical protein UT04_C0033G0001 [Candidatus Daviesbacteria bacterium GW2011_GWF2_38_7]|nr:MAG: hypothetical protein UT04_C0033G0001 [Candidatus Daviesbacteria bacterium GW2011_GWF2_38_7]
MKKLLPKTANNPKGFTLIELMVVVTIIAILSVIGISVYTNAQKNARDGIRRAELSSLGKAIESAKDPTTSSYMYNTTNFTSDYPQNLPRDPLKDSGKQYYCVSTSTGATPAMPLVPTAWALNCPTDTGANYTAWTTLVDKDGAYNAAANGLIAGARYWRICTKLEGPVFPTTGSNPYCVSSSQ